MEKVFWYSTTQKALVHLEPSEFELESIKKTLGNRADLACIIRASSLGLIPVIPIWTYGTLMKGESAADIMSSIALPEFKPVAEFVEGIRLYTNPSVPFPAAVLAKGARTFMERYLVRPESLQHLDTYEGAPALYDLVPLPNGEGWFYCWNMGLTDWVPSCTGDWHDR